MAMLNPHIQVLTIDQAESRDWDCMVAGHALGSVYHHTAFGRVVASTFGHTKPYYLALLDRDDRYVGGLVTCVVRSWLTGNRLVSVPWACYADPLVNSHEEFAALFREVTAFARRERASYIEIRTRDTAALLGATNLMVPICYDKTHFLDLAIGLGSVWDRFRTNTKRSIRKAEKQGVEVRLARSEEEVVSFYEVFVRNRRRLGLPPQRLAYFRNIWLHMVPRGLARFWLAYVRDEPVGGLCCFHFKEKVFWTYIGVDEPWLRLGIGQFLIWTVIRTASEEGLRIVDLGKTSRNAYGLLHYKRGWGAVEAEAPVFYYPRVMGVSSRNNDQSLSYRILRAFWRTAPASLSRIASQFFYRHTG